MCACAVSFSVFYLFFNCCVRQARIRKEKKTVAQVIMDACAAYIYYIYKSKIEQEQDLDVCLVCANICVQLGVIRSTLNKTYIRINE